MVRNEMQPLEVLQLFCPAGIWGCWEPEHLSPVTQATRSSSSVTMILGSELCSLLWKLSHLLCSSLQPQTVTSPKLSSSSGCRAWLSPLSLWTNLALAGGDPCWESAAIPGLLHWMASLTSSPFFPQLQKGPGKTLPSACGCTTSGYMELNGSQCSTFMALKLRLDFCWAARQSSLPQTCSRPKAKLHPLGKLELKKNSHTPWESWSWKFFCQVHEKHQETKGCPDQGMTEQDWLMLLHPSISLRQSRDTGTCSTRSHRTGISLHSPSSPRSFSLQQWVSPPHSFQLKRSDLTRPKAGRTLTFTIPSTCQCHHRLHSPTLPQLQPNRSHKVNNPWCNLVPIPLFLPCSIWIPLFWINAREITFISKRLMRLFLKSEPDDQFEGYKKGKTISFGVSLPHL